MLPNTRVSISKAEKSTVSEEGALQSQMSILLHSCGTFEGAIDEESSYLPSNSGGIPEIAGREHIQHAIHADKVARRLTTKESVCQ